MASSQTQWSAGIADISARGAKLIVHRRFERDTLLHIELPSTSESENTGILARVAHVTKEKDGRWGLGCSFVKPLSEEELQTFLDKALVPVRRSAPR
jgi:hypothetical protein